MFTAVMEATAAQGLTICRIQNSIEICKTSILKKFRIQSNSNIYSPAFALGLQSNLHIVLKLERTTNKGKTVMQIKYRLHHIKLKHDSL